MKETTHLFFEDAFYEQFSVDSGIIAFFVSIKNTKDPLESFDNMFDFWIDHKKRIVKDIIEISLEVNKEPEKYSEEYREIYGGIQLEDYEINSNKALMSLKIKIKDEFKEFLEKTK
tara:strand:+ start:12099 stop:12446 length:348 start_codon:yes stop_codon:yes gene_type:complete